MSKAALKPAASVTEQVISRADLPLRCPMPGQAVWNAHPTVYLPIEDHGGRIRCPYCGTLYVLKD